MALVVRKAYTGFDHATSINKNLHQFMTWGPVYPSANMSSGVPVRIAFNVGRNRYEATPAGGAGYANNAALQAIVHGITGSQATFGTGPNAKPILVLLECELGDVTTDITTAIYPLYLSAATAGELDTVAPFATAIPVGLRMGYHAGGEKVYFNANGARFGQF